MRVSRPKRPTKTAELEAVRNKLLSIHAEDQQFWQNKFAEQDRSLESASRGELQSATDRPWSRFSLANHRQALGGREAVLFNPVWDDTLRMWPYPPMRLALRWPYRWGGRCGQQRNCANWYIVQQIGDTGSVGVRYSTGVDGNKVMLLLLGVPFGVEAIDDLPSVTVISHSSEELHWRGFHSVQAHIRDRCWEA